MTSPRSFLLLVLAASTLVVFGCSSTSDEGAETTTSSSSTTTTAPPTSRDETTTIAPSTSTATTSGEDEITVAVYWTRPYGQARPIDIPGYRDDPNGPFPFVLYGSATNTGQVPIAQPRIDVEWSADGEVVHTTVVAVRDPQGGDSAELAPGAAGDLIVVVDDAAAANRLTDAVPTFEVHR